MGTQVKLNLAGIREMKRQPGITSMIREKAENVAAAARASATNENFRDHIVVNMDTHTISGSVAHIMAYASNAEATEAKHGTLARALDSA